jgi:glycosyltransferase involved in cell wall biosynthesis
MRTQRLLVVAERLPRAAESAGDNRFAALLSLLARRHDVDVWAEQGHCGARLTADVTVLPPGWASLAGALGTNRYDVGFFEFYFAATRYGAAFRAIQPHASTLVDSVDLHYARLAAGAALGVEASRDVEDIRRRELEAYRAADAVLVASTSDAEELRSVAPGVRTFVVPIMAASARRTTEARDHDVLFVGHFDHRPNRDGLEWIVRESWPMVRREVPDARLIVIGSRMPGTVRELGSVPGVEIVGRVADVAPFLRRAAVSVAPLRYGAGMKGKVVEAMAAGVPVVTTPVGAQGLAVRSGEHLLVAESGHEMAACIVRLLRDPADAARLGLAGQQHIVSLCHPDRIAACLDETLDALATLDRARSRDGRRNPAARAWLRSTMPVCRARAGYYTRRLAAAAGSAMRPSDGEAPPSPPPPGRRAVPFVTVVLCTRNRPESAAAAARSILDSPYPAFEVRIIDQSDNERTREILAPLLGSRVSYLSSASRGLSIARNLGIASARGELIALTDDDCRVSRTWIGDLAAGFGIDERIGVVFGNVLAGPGDRSCGFVTAYVRTAPYLARSVRDKHRVEGIGASMAIRRAVWERLGGFDPLLGAGAPLKSAEDTDFTIRALLAGYFVYDSAQATVTHHGFRTWRDGQPLVRDYLYGIGATLMKHLRCGHWRVLYVFGRLAWRWTFARPVVDVGDRSLRWVRLFGALDGLRAGAVAPLDRRRAVFMSTTAGSS